MKKWKALRDNYVKELKEQKKIQTGVPAKKRKTYVFFEQLSFLAPHVLRIERTTSNIGPPQTVQGNDELEEENTEPTEFNDSGTITETDTPAAIAERQKKQGNTKNNRTAIAKSIASTTKELTQILAKSVEQQKEERSADKYGNKSFLMSFIPMMDKLPMEGQMQARFKILQVFNDLSYMYSVPGTSPSPSTSSTSMSVHTDCATPSSADNVQGNGGSEYEDNFDITKYLKL